METRSFNVTICAPTIDHENVKLIKQKIENALTEMLSCRNVSFEVKETANQFALHSMYTITRSTATDDFDRNEAETERVMRGM